MSHLRSAASWSVAASLTLLVGVGCSSSGNQGGNAGSDGGAGRAPTAGHGCAADLTGTWDLVSSAPGKMPGAGVVVLGANVSSIAITSTGNPNFAGDKLEYTAGVATMATWQIGSNPPRVIMIQNTPAPLDSGSLPIAAGGAWRFTTDDERCTVNVASDLIQGNCTGRPVEDYDVSGPDWPVALPRAVNGRVYAANHMSTASSSFGALGGEWIAQRTPSTIDSGTCDVTLEGGNFVGRCNIPQLSGLAMLTVSDDCVASGSTLSGFELSARRR